MDNPYQMSLAQTKQASTVLSSVLAEKKNNVLSTLAEKIGQRTQRIIEANKRDVTSAKNAGQDEAFINRLTVTENTIESIIKGIHDIIGLDDPVGKIIEKRRLENGIDLHKVSVPLGVIAVIYESRPNVTIDAAALCLKSGNAIVLKGGSESIETNSVFVSAFHDALSEQDIPKGVVLFLDTDDRSVVEWLLTQEKFVDVVIPRGGYGLVRTVVEHSRIPILYHAEGGSRIYVDKSADLSIALKVVLDSKTSRPATCNSMDTLVIHEAVAKDFLPKAVNALQEKQVELIGDNKSQLILSEGMYQSVRPEAKNPDRIIEAERDSSGINFRRKFHYLDDNIQIDHAQESDWIEEFLRLKASIKIVKDVDEAIQFVMKYTKHHTEGIIAQDEQVISKFTSSIDAAALFVNCSTRLHDGGVFGMGAEMGIATGKLHARGPVGIKELTTYKWIAKGSGQVRE